MAMRFARIGIANALSVAVTLVGGVCLADEAARSAAVAAAPAQPAPAAEARFTGKLKNGVSVELLGLVQGRVVRERWRADGTPDPHAMFEKARFDRAKVVHAPEEHLRPGVGVVVRFNLKLRDGSLASSDSEKWFCTALDAKDEPVEGIVVLYGMGDPKKKTNDLRFDLATGAWEGTDVRAAAGELGETKDDVQFTKAETLRGGTYVGLIASNERWARDGAGVKRLCARDAAGKTRVAIPFQPRGEGPPAPTEYGFLFEEVEPSDLHEFWMERRAAEEWVEFRNVAFESGAKTEVKIVTSDDPPETEPKPEGL